MTTIVKFDPVPEGDIAYVQLIHPLHDPDTGEREWTESIPLIDNFGVFANHGIESGKLIGICFAELGKTFKNAPHLLAYLERDIAARIALWRVLAALSQLPGLPAKPQDLELLPPPKFE